MLGSVLYESDIYVYTFLLDFFIFMHIVPFKSMK